MKKMLQQYSSAISKLDKAKQISSRDSALTPFDKLVLCLGKILIICTFVIWVVCKLLPLI